MQGGELHNRPHLSVRDTKKVQLKQRCAISTASEDSAEKLLKGCFDRSGVHSWTVNADSVRIHGHTNAPVVDDLGRILDGFMIARLDLVAEPTDHARLRKSTGYDEIERLSYKFRVRFAEAARAKICDQVTAE